MNPEKKLDRRDIVSLIAMFLSLAAAIVYWLNFAGQSEYTYNVLPDATYRYIIEPVFMASLSFFLSSHLRARIAIRDASLHIVKIACLLFSAVYATCLIVVMVYGTWIDYGTLLAMMTYFQAFLPHAPVFIGLILGIRTAENH